MTKEPKLRTWKEWRREIQRRVAEVEAGTVTLVPWTEVRSRMMAKLRDARRSVSGRRRKPIAEK